MRLNLRLAVIAGIVWGIIAVLLALAARLLSGLAPSVEGLPLETYAVLFAGVHFVARNKGRFLEDLIGGIIAGIIAALFLLLLSLIGLGVGGGNLVSVLIQGILVGAAGALGMVLVKHINP